MQSQIIIAENAFDSKTWKEFDTENVLEFISHYFETWPETARIYYGPVCKENDVTPRSEFDIEKLSKLEGKFTVVVYPQGPLAIIAVVLIIVAIAAVMFLTKKPVPTISSAANAGGGSPNNDLSDRSNKARPNERIPDIYGQVRATPDLISRTYSTYVNHQEVEHSFMCLGRGEYSIADIRDDTTLISEIEGSTVQVYAPGTSPNGGGLPIITVGESVDEPVRSVVESSSVNGQTLLAPNARFYVGSSDVIVGTGGRIIVNNINVNFVDIFAPGDTIVFTNGFYDYTYGVGLSALNVDFSGTYTLQSVDEQSVTLAPGYDSINGNWAVFNSRNGNATAYKSATVTGVNDQWIGPYLIELPSMSEIITNFVAESGLYSNDGTNYFPLNVDVDVEFTPVDSTNTPIGAIVTFSVTVVGSSTLRNQRAATIVADVPSCSRALIRARRTSNTNTAWVGTIQDEVKWKDLYGSKIVTQIGFGNVTTVLAVTKATANALSISSRKLNMLVTRLVPQVNPDNTFSNTLIASTYAPDIICAICLDAYIGNRSIDEIDVAGIYATFIQSQVYFGTAYASQFCYTFDDKTLSFEETITQIADAVFCTAYRQGTQIKLFFEKQTNDSVLLFNHRNKIPGSETRSIRFGNADGYDGIEYTYVDPGDEATITLYVPPDKSATSAKQFTGTGVRNNVQAYFQAWRLYQKLVYQNTTVEFTGTSEAKLLVLNERILVADNTRPDTQDGEVLSQNALELETSQPVTFVSGKTYTMFLQYADGSVDPITITAGSDSFRVILATAPTQALSTDARNYARTGYIIVASDDVQQRAFLLTASDPQDNYSSKLTAINYSDKYYEKDIDFITGAVQYVEYADNNES